MGRERLFSTFFSYIWNKFVINENKGYEKLEKSSSMFGKCRFDA